MSEPVSALKGAKFDGLVQVAEAGVQGMISLRGDLADAGLRAAVEGFTGAAFPEARMVSAGATGSALWMSPDELLLLCSRADAPAKSAELAQTLSGSHALVAEISDARAMFTLNGTHVREVLAKLCPADMAPGALPVNELRRTKLAQVAAAVWLSDDATAHVICFRSVADYAFGALKAASHKASAVNHLV
jgi:sarcosine oxidase subunit gamma